ncbi:MAG TPA: hypothetical protein VF461_10135 [Gemmatimonadaceae bacterium]
MRSITTRFADERLRFAVRVLYYLLILIAASVVTRVTDHATIRYIYQDY